jgi:hypothetical protein
MSLGKTLIDMLFSALVAEWELLQHQSPPCSDALPQAQHQEQLAAAENAWQVSGHTPCAYTLHAAYAA